MLLLSLKGRSLFLKMVEAVNKYPKEEGDSEGWKVLLLDAIQGFQYEVGYEYTLRVNKYNIPNPPQDGSSIGYKLIKTISKKKQ